jgi:hypothetical protein
VLANANTALEVDTTSNSAMRWAFTPRRVVPYPPLREPTPLIFLKKIDYNLLL